MFASAKADSENEITKMSSKDHSLYEEVHPLDIISTSILQKPSKDNQMNVPVQVKPD